MNRDEYAKIIYFWKGAPDLEKLPELLGDLQDKGWPNTDARKAAAAGVINGLAFSHPTEMYGWDNKFPRLADLVAAVVTKSGKERADYFIGFWLVTHDDDTMDLLLNLYHDGGERGRYAGGAIGVMDRQCIPFHQALEDAKARRRAAMVIQ